MPPISKDAGPLNSAHMHAANADDHLANGLLIPAAEEHYKAAEAFQVCVDQSSDDSTKRTLRMLHNDHLKAGKELQRKIEKLRAEGKDPALPHLPLNKTPAPTSSRSTRPTSPQRAGTGPSTANGASPPPGYSSLGSRMIDSGDTVEESFMVLGQRSQHDPNDAFNQFWKRMEEMEGMLDTFHKPLAFVTTPLDAPAPPTKRTKVGRDGNSSSDTDFEDPMAVTRAKMAQRKAGAGAPLRTSAMTFPPPRVETHVVDLRSELDEVLADDGDDLSESFCLIPSSNDSSGGTSGLRKENAQLKEEVQKMHKRLEAAERVMKMRREQDAQLRDSIVMARKEAQRAMASSVMAQRNVQPPPIVNQLPTELNALSLNIPALPPAISALNAGKTGRDREPGLVLRVRELEEDVRVLRVENEKQKAMITRFRERWEKLKESAKRKKQAKAATAVVGERIDEDPEAEERAEEQEKSERDALDPTVP